MAKEVNDMETRQDERRYYSPIQKEAATFLETSEETGGEYTLIEMEVGPGGGPPPHYHMTYDEHFEVIEGTLQLQVGRKMLVLRAGEKAVAPINTLHRFHNATDETIRFLIEFRPGSSGFEKTMQVSFGLARDGLTFSNGMPKSPYHLALTLEWADIRLPGVFTVAAPLMQLLAKRARHKGIDRELEARYVR